MDPKSFLDRFERRPSPPADLTSALANLARLPRDRPDLEAPARSLSRLLDIAFRAPDPSRIEDFDPGRLVRAWSAGTPAFREISPRLDEPALISRIASLAEAIGGKDASTLRRAIRKNQSGFLAMVSEILSGHPEEVVRRATEIGVGDQFLASVLRLALLPALSRFSAVLDPLRPEGIWNRGDCSNCGSRPLLAESRGIDQRIVYRCGLCASAWPGQRLQCPSCGESGPKALGFSFIEGEQDRFRLGHCQTCSAYWKVISTLSALSTPSLLVADLATFHLDVLAPGS